MKEHKELSYEARAGMTNYSRERSEVRISSYTLLKKNQIILQKGERRNYLPTEPSSVHVV